LTKKHHPLRMQPKAFSELERSLIVCHERDYPIDGQALQRKKDETSIHRDPISHEERWGFLLSALDRRRQHKMSP